MKKTVSYVIFAGICTAFFLFYLFPKETLIDYVEYQIYRLDPSFRLTIGDLQPYYPPYVKGSDVAVYYQQAPVLTVSSALVRPGLATFFSNGTIVTFKGQINEGRFNGHVKREGGFKAAQITVDMDLDRIQLEDINGLRSISGVSLAGQIAGKVTHSNGKSKPRQGKADLILSDCTFQLADSYFGIKGVRFSRIELGLTLQDRTLSLDRIDMTGSQINARFNGTVAIQSPYNRSQLKLKGKIRPHAEFLARLKKEIPAPLWPDKQTLNKGLPITISGTVKRPQLAMK